MESPIPAHPPTSTYLPHLLATQWAETLRQTACLEVLLAGQARLLAAVTGETVEQVAQAQREQIAATLSRLAEQHVFPPAVATSPPACVPSDGGAETGTSAPADEATNGPSGASTEPLARE